MGTEQTLAAQPSDTERLVRWRRWVNSEEGLGHYEQSELLLFAERQQAQLADCIEALECAVDAGEMTIDTFDAKWRIPPDAAPYPAMNAAIRSLLEEIHGATR